jgi:hypothetical protein
LWAEESQGRQKLEDWWKPKERLWVEESQGLQKLEDWWKPQGRLSAEESQDSLLELGFRENWWEYL